jgi:hypothetical protein
MERRLEVMRSAANQCEHRARRYGLEPGSNARTART